jgi:hypothetical protein
MAPPAFRRGASSRRGPVLALLVLALLAALARAEGPKKTVAWGKSAVYIKGKWVPFDEDDEAGVPQPYPPKTDSWKGNDTTIMVSISSFRDYRCAKTLYNLFTCVLLWSLFCAEQENKWK